MQNIITYPIKEIEWKYQKQLFQVQKSVHQVVKFNNSKKWQKQTIFMVKLSIKSVFFNWFFYELIHTFFGLELAVFDISTQFPQWGNIFTLVDIEKTK